MKIYFCGAIAAGRQNLPAYQRIVAHLKAAGHRVLTEHVADPDVLTSEKLITPREVYERDAAWLGDCDVVVAEVSLPSLGVGYEIARALQMGKPTICLYREGLEVSRMITGNTSPFVSIATWKDTSDLVRIIDAFLCGKS